MAHIDVEEAEVDGRVMEMEEGKNVCFNPNLTEKTAEECPALLQFIRAPLTPF